MNDERVGFQFFKANVIMRSWLEKKVVLTFYSYSLMETLKNKSGFIKYNKTDLVQRITINN